MMKKIIPLIALCPALSFAFFCPSTFNQIDYGMTISQVTSACGAPASQVKSTKQQDNMPQEWTYYVPQTVLN